MWAKIGWSLNLEKKTRITVLAVKSVNIQMGLLSGLEFKQTKPNPLTEPAKSLGNILLSLQCKREHISELSTLFFLA